MKSEEIKMYVLCAVIILIISFISGLAGYSISVKGIEIQCNEFIRVHCECHTEKNTPWFQDYEFLQDIYIDEFNSSD